MTQKVDSFSSRLRQALSDARMTQSELAKSSGVSKSSISHYVKGDWEAKQDAVYALARTLGVQEAWLMGFDVSPCSSTPPAVTPEAMDIARAYDRADGKSRDIVRVTLAEYLPAEKETRRPLAG